MADLVAALKWVQENVANFGGDPNNVMIYGQSGGGGKVAALMGMPSAKGLFHRAAIQSGGGMAAPADEAKEFARTLVKHLGIGANDIAALQKMDWATLNAACDAAQAKMPPRAMPFGPMPGPPRRFWMPTLDGHVITVNAFQDAAPEISKDVPLVIGSVSEEGNSMRSRPTEAQWRANLIKAYGETKGKALADTLRKAHPEKSIRTLSYMCGGGGILNAISIRNNVVRMAKLKHDLHAAPVYTYYFSWQSPMLEDAGAWHTADLQFCFDNTKRCEQGTGNTPEAQALAKKMATAWANFARTGNPSQPGLEWTPSDPERNQTMVWDNDCRMVDDPEGEIRKIILS
jgi:para-nitrobenzyl esterase